MKPWRPEGWDNPYREFDLDIDKLGEKHISLRVLSEKEAKEADKHVVFEVGADDILEALEPLIRKIAPSSKLIDILYPDEDLT